MYNFTGNWNPNDFDMDEIFKAALAVLELGILEPRAQILGGLVIFDLENFSLQQAWHVTPSVASKVLDLMGVSIPYFRIYYYNFFFKLVSLTTIVNYKREK